MGGIASIFASSDSPTNPPPLNLLLRSRTAHPFQWRPHKCPPHIPDTGNDGIDIEHLIDRSECGAWDDALKYVQFPVSEVRKDDRQGGGCPLNANASLPVSDVSHDKGSDMIDPLIQQARAVNDLGAYAARLEANLAKRKALRTEPHKRGHMTRRGVGA